MRWWGDPSSSSLPLFRSDRGQVLLPPFHQAGSPNTLAVFSRGKWRRGPGEFSSLRVGLASLLPTEASLEPWSATTGKRGGTRGAKHLTGRAATRVGECCPVPGLNGGIRASDPALTETSGQSLETSLSSPTARRPGTPGPKLHSNALMMQTVPVRPAR